MTRYYSWPDGHWNWPVKLTHQHGVRHGDMLFTGGQVDLDTLGNVRNSGDLAAQCGNAMDYLRIVLEDLGSGFADLVKLVVYFVGDHEAETALVKQIAGIIGDGPKPVINTIGLDALAYPGLMVEIEGVAVAATRQSWRLDDFVPLPSAFSHVIRCSDMVFTGDISAMDGSAKIKSAGDLAGQTEIMMQRLNKALETAGCDINDVVKLNVFYTGDGTAEDWEAPAKIRASHFPDPGPAATGVPMAHFPHRDMCAKIAVTAMRGQDNQPFKKTYSWPQGHWDWTTPLPYKHGNKCGNMIHVGGQVSLDSSGKVIDPDNMVAQTRTAMDNIAKVLGEFGAGFNDVVKVTTFYQGEASADALHENLLIRSNSYRPPGPASSGIPVKALAYERMVIEIEVIAMLEH